MVERVQLSAEFETQISPISRAPAIANTEDKIQVSGVTEGPFAAGVAIGSDGSFTITEINNQEFDTSVSLAGINDGECELFIIAAGEGGFGSSTIIDVSDLEQELIDSKKTQSDRVQKLTSLTVGASGSNDSQYNESVLVEKPKIFLESFNDRSVKNVNDDISIIGRTNVSEIDSVIRVEIESGQTKFVDFIQSWSSGQYNQVIDLSGVNVSITPGTYTVTVSSSGTSDSKEINIVSVRESKRQAKEERSDGDVSSFEEGTVDGDISSTSTVDDSSFTGFTQLDKDVYIHELDFEVEIADSYWKIIELKIHRKQYQESDAVDLLAIPDPKRNPKAVPKSGDEIKINAGPEQDVADPDKRPKETIERSFGGDGKIERLFTGTVSTVQKRGDGSWKMFAFTHQLDIVTTRISVSTDEFVPASELFKTVMKRVDAKVDGTNLKAEPNNDNVNVNYGVPASEQQVVYRNKGGFNSQVNSDRVNFSTAKAYTNVVAKSIIEDIGLSTNSVFWVDKSNTIQFGPPKSKIHKLSFVTESDARVQTPPYRSVKVIGDDISQKPGEKPDGSTAQTGVSSINLIGDDPTVETQALLVNENGRFEIKRNELREPTYVYKDESIRTRREARNVAQDLLEKINEERSEGKIIIPGRPMIDIFDVVEVPDSFAVTKDGRQLPPDQYVVKEVIHRVNDSDGFITELIIGGLVNRYDAPIYKFISETESGKPIVTRFDPDETRNAELPTYLVLQNLDRDTELPTQSSGGSQNDESDETESPPARGNR